MSATLDKVVRLSRELARERLHRQQLAPDEGRKLRDVGVRVGLGVHRVRWTRMRRRLFVAFETLTR